MYLKDRKEFLPEDSVKDEMFSFFTFFIFFSEGLKTAADNLGSTCLKSFSPELFPLLNSAFRKMRSLHKDVKQAGCF